MKDAPEIAPEIRGLLEEIVADPRSAIRLAPRRALLPWLESGDTARVSEISSTNAERELLKVQREALAKLLYEAARIAYWKAPPLPSHRPVGRDGMPYDPIDGEPLVLRCSRRRLARSEGAPGVDLLRQCFEGIRPEQGPALVRASLSLVPRDEARVLLGLILGKERPRTAMVVLRRLSATTVEGSIKGHALRGLGACLYGVRLFSEARRSYERSAFHGLDSACSWLYVLNLSCLLVDERTARLAVDEIHRRMDEQAPRIEEGLSLIASAIKDLDPASIQNASAILARLKGGIAAPLVRLGELYDLARQA